MKRATGECGQACGREKGCVPQGDQKRFLGEGSIGDEKPREGEAF